MGGTGRDGAKSDAERQQARADEMELIREAQAGSRVAFDTLVRQYEHQVLRLALHLTVSDHEAEGRARAPRGQLRLPDVPGSAGEQAGPVSQLRDGSRTGKSGGCNSDRVHMPDASGDRAF